MTAGASDATDAALAARAARGDRSAFNALIQRYQEPLYRFVRRYVGDADEAYDLVQETWVAAWQAMGRFDAARPAITWLRRIALNKCRDWSRRRKVRRFFYGAGPLESEAYRLAGEVADDVDEGAVARLDAAIAALPSQLKEPLLLTAFEGLSHEEAGAALGVTAKAIETRLYRARKALAATLGADADDAPV